MGEFIYIGEGNKAYSFLNRLRADVFVLTTPGLDVLHIKRNAGVKHYCHIVHSLTPVTYRVFGLDYFDSVLVANAVQRDYVRDIESARNVKKKYIAITGSPYLDELSNQSNGYSQSTDSVKTILLSPSWGKETLLSKYGLELLLPLAKSNFKIIIRPHPQSFISPSERENIERLQVALKEYKNVEWDRDTPNVKAFARADMMISDFSSVIFDFVCLQGKPVLTIDNDMDFSGYDMEDIPRERIWTFGVLDSIGGRMKASEFSRIKELCWMAMSNSNSSFQRNLACSEGNLSLGNNFCDYGDLEAITHKMSNQKSTKNTQSNTETRITGDKTWDFQASLESSSKDSKEVSKSTALDSPSPFHSKCNEESTTPIITVGQRLANKSVDSKPTSANMNAPSAIEQESHQTTAQNIESIRSLLWQHPHRAGRMSALELLKIEREIIEAELKSRALFVARLRELDSMIYCVKKKCVKERKCMEERKLGQDSKELEQKLHKDSKQDLECQNLTQNKKKDSTQMGKTQHPKVQSTTKATKDCGQTRQDFTKPKGVDYE